MLYHFKLLIEYNIKSKDLNRVWLFYYMYFFSKVWNKNQLWLKYLTTYHPHDECYDGHDDVHDDHQENAELMLDELQKETVLSMILNPLEEIFGRLMRTQLMQIEITEMIQKNLITNTIWKFKICYVFFGISNSESQLLAFGGKFKTSFFCH